MKRYCEKFLYKDLQKKMVFLGGPRQVGKTTLSKRLRVDDFASGVYLNWDKDSDRQDILKGHWLSTTPLVIFDELHKYPYWKRWIKGIYDTRPPNQTYLVTGSARLDVYRRGGDSLMGRYHYWRLHPLTLDELPPGIEPEEGLRRLLTLGGFPEPFLTADDREAKRWRRERFDRIVREDVRDLEAIHNLSLLSLFIDALRERVSGLITLSNLAGDLQISPKTAKSWLALIERMYIAFPIYPLVKQVPRSIQKPPKVYFYDNADAVDNKGARLENLVATHLLKRLHFLEDYQGSRCGLYYIRDKDGREVDFVTTVDGKIIDLIEVKVADGEVSSSLHYYAERLKPVRAVQIVGQVHRPFHSKGILVTNPIDFFTDPPWKF